MKYALCLHNKLWIQTILLEIFTQWQPTWPDCIGLGWTFSETLTWEIFNGIVSVNLNKNETIFNSWHFDSILEVLPYAFHRHCLFIRKIGCHDDKVSFLKNSINAYCVAVFNVYPKNNWAPSKESTVDGGLVSGLTTLKGMQCGFQCDSFSHAMQSICSFRNSIRASWQSLVHIYVLRRDTKLYNSCPYA